MPSVRGAPAVVEGGIAVPLRFGDPAAEALRCAGAVGVADASSSVLLRVGGADRVSFLHRILSSDVKSLAVGGGGRGLLLTAKGKVVAPFRLAVLPDRVEIVAPAEARPALAVGLARFAVADDVTFEDRAGRAALFRVLGPRSAAAVARVAGEGPPGAIPRDGAVDLVVAGVPATLHRADACGLPGFAVACDAGDGDRVWEALLGAARAEGGGPAGRDALEILRVEAGEPRLGRECGEDTLPQEAGLEDHVSFTKGCFLGQEPVARLRNRGHTNRGLAGLDLGTADPPAPGAPVLHGDREVGRVTSAVRSPRLGRSVALALLRHEAAAPGTVLAVPGKEGATLPAVAASLPLVPSPPGA